MQPVGRSMPMVVDTRVIAATNQDLHQAVAERTFRADLMFRLDVVQLRVKPLRDRPTELPLLLDEFNREFADAYRQAPLVWDRQALNLLRSYAWPGNIRQLRSVVERLHILCPARTVTMQRLIEVGQLQQPQSADARIQSLQQVKAEAVRRVLADANGSVTRAAAVFGVHRSTIYRWLKDIRGRDASGDRPPSA